ncbi:MAG: hypothetical protein AAFX81_03035 [Pseudomonadota bacterium]
MDPALLQTLLTAGPSRRLDVLASSQELRSKDPAAPLMFNTPYLNRSVILKFVDPKGSDQADRRSGAMPKPIRTLIYLPYDVTDPPAGGESLLYSRRALRRLHFQKTNEEPDGQGSFAADEATMQALDDVPAFNPFLLRDAFERAGLPLHEAYLDLDQGTAKRIRRRLLLRIRPLIVAVLGSSSGLVGEALEHMVDAFLDPARKEELRPLAAALHLRSDDAVEVLGAWAGIAYFEEELERLTPQIASLAQWLATSPRPRERVPPSAAKDFASQIQRIRIGVRTAWQSLQAILGQYQASYRSLVVDSQPAPFVEFLRDCRQHYWSAGDLFGRFEQSIYGWRVLTQNYQDESLPLIQYTDLLAFLLRTHLLGRENVLEAPAAERPAAASPA